MARPNNLQIHCSTLVFLLATSLVFIKANATVRLVNNFDTETNKGRVEIFYGDAWGTICDDNWDILDADVVCRQLGYTGAIRALKRAYFGPGDNLIWIDDVACTGNEKRIQDCPNAGWGTHDCLHLEDASVECSTATVRLVGGPDRYEGNVQVLDDEGNDWGYVCDDRWDDFDAQVACYQLDQRGHEHTRNKSAYGTKNDGPLVLNNLDCAGNEDALQRCPNRGIKNCMHSDKAGVGCFRDAIEEGSVRLAGTGYPNRGRVEVYHNEEWGTVCDDYWDYYDAKVVCRQLGFIDSQPKAYYKSYFGAGDGRIWLDNMACGGGEDRLEYCISSNGWGTHDCSHGEDAGVYCDERGDFDAAEITGIILASLFGASILFCCVKYICCEAASNKRQQRRRRSRGRRQSRRSPTAATRPTDPEEHFNAHFNSAYTISDNYDEIFTPPGFPFAYPSSAPPPFSPTDLPPAYDTIMSTSGPADGGTPVTSGDTAMGNSVGASDNVTNPIAMAPAPPRSTTSVNAGPVPMPESNFAYPLAQPASNRPYPPEPVMSQQQAPIPANPTAAMPSIEAVAPPPYAMAASHQLEQNNEPLSPSSSCQPTYQVPIEGQVQQSPAAPSPVKSVTVAETPATNDQAHSHPNTFEETSITYIANAEESIDLGLPK
eukprot:XP_798676.3 PREDICTED: neurotrypsin [Strongylocentrotus purpuratus]